MKTNEKLYLLGAGLLATATPFMDVAFIILLMGALGLLMFFAVGFLISSIFLGRRALKCAFYLAIPILFCFTAYFINRSIRHTKAKNVVEEIEKFRLSKGVLPDSLKNITTVSIIGLTYNLDSINQTYWLKYDIDAVNKEYYNSKNRSWETHGWND